LQKILDGTKGQWPEDLLEVLWVISLSLGDQIITTLATSVLPVCSEENS